MKYVYLVEGQYAPMYGTTSEMSWIMGAYTTQEQADARKAVCDAARKDPTVYYTVKKLPLDTDVYAR